MFFKKFCIATRTIKAPDFDKKSGAFLTFYANSHWLQICFGDNLGTAPIFVNFAAWKNRTF